MTKNQTSAVGQREGMTKTKPVLSGKREGMTKNQQEIRKWKISK